MMRIIFIILFAGVWLTAFTQPSPLNLPEESQEVFLQQHIGLSDISIRYHSPLTNNRKIFGGLVPYNTIWRAGANENTIISFSHDVLVENNLLKAGTYGLHMIPTETEWVIIFSTDNGAWGSYYYRASADALRINSLPTDAPSQNWLSYSFINPLPNQVTIQLRWEKISIQFQVAVKGAEQLVFENIQRQLTTRNGFFWEGYAEAAQHCLANNHHLTEAMNWINKSISLKTNYRNLMIKSRLYKKLNQPDSAAYFSEAAFSQLLTELSIASESEINNTGYNYLRARLSKEALQIFKMNVQKHPASWNALDSYAETLLANGNKKEAAKYYQLALTKKIPLEQQKRINSLLKDIKP
jgi:Protein of unknown function (DUF2911)